MFSNAKQFIRAAYLRTLIEGLRPNAIEESGSIKLIALENHRLAAKTEEAEKHEAICVVDLVKDPFVAASHAPAGTGPTVSLSPRDSSDA